MANSGTSGGSSAMKARAPRPRSMLARRVIRTPASRIRSVRTSVRAARVGQEGDRLQQRRQAGVVALVDLVAEAGEAFPPAEAFDDDRRRAALLALGEQLVGEMGGGAVERTLDHGQPGGERLVRRRPRRAGDPDGERAGGQLVVGQQDERPVDDGRQRGGPRPASSRRPGARPASPARRRPARRGPSGRHRAAAGPRWAGRRPTWRVPSALATATIAGRAGPPTTRATSCGQRPVGGIRSRPRRPRPAGCPSTAARPPARTTTSGRARRRRDRDSARRRRPASSPW